MVHSRASNGIVDLCCFGSSRFYSVRIQTVTHRTPLSDLTWNDKPLAQLSRDELIQLVGVLHDLVWRSAENFERLLGQQMQSVKTRGRG